MKSLTLYLCLLVTTLSYSSVFSSPSTSLNSVDNSYAVVIGISDYQHKDIPDLRFAHRDAEAFSDFLQSPASGQVPRENIKLFTNEQATYQNIIAAMNWLLEVSQEGNKVYIYFSGHGDVEKHTGKQLGFLLPWDAPAHSYMAGAFPTFYLKEIIQTLSIENKAQVIMIADACRSGYLAGNQMNSNQLSNHNLIQKFANEIKILSCQPNEYSIEGEQWGGGRGVFSYFLIKGLSGEADKDKDGVVNLLEISRYLEDQVPSETTMHNQIPFTTGNRMITLSQVESTFLAHSETTISDEQDVIEAEDLEPTEMLIQVKTANR